jgi:CDP-diacylglycerol--glycerol-3-phosphate 3-phosphatidyltransferase
VCGNKQEQTDLDTARQNSAVQAANLDAQEQSAAKDMSSRIMTPANVITVLRICLVPVFVVALLTPWPEWMQISALVPDAFKSLIATILFIVISCTDWIDGYLARSRGEVTNFGKFMDPLADKILVLAALLALVELGVLPSWPVMIILAREFIVSGMRMVAASEGVVIAASWYGKSKTVLQIIAIVLFLVKDSALFAGFSNDTHYVLYVLAWVVMTAALIMTIVSMVDYLAKGWSILRFGASASDAKVVQGANVASSKDLSDVDACDEDKHSNVAYKLNEECIKLAEVLVACAKDKGVVMASAESLTGGMIAQYITSVPGSSAVFNGAIVSYVNEIKHARLGVGQKVLNEQGAVSPLCAKEMALGAKSELGATVAVSVTGIAGPTGALPGKPVGCVYMGIVDSGNNVKVERFNFDGNREEIRLQTTKFALMALLEIVRK